LVPPNTLLVITPLSPDTAFMLPPFSTRNATQTLEPIVGTGSGSSISGTLARRSINAKMIDLTNPVFRKYATQITCKDTQAPALDGGWLGATVQIECAAELNYLTGGTPQRPVVPGSSREEEHFTFYRPILVAVITLVKHAFIEWEGEYSWTLEAMED